MLQENFSTHVLEISDTGHIGEFPHTSMCLLVTAAYLNFNLNFILNLHLQIEI